MFVSWMNWLKYSVITHFCQLNGSPRSGEACFLIMQGRWYMEGLSTDKYNICYLHEILKWDNFLWLIVLHLAQTLKTRPATASSTCLNPTRVKSGHLWGGPFRVHFALWGKQELLKRMSGKNRHGLFSRTVIHVPPPSLLIHISSFFCFPWVCRTKFSLLLSLLI